MEAQEAGGTVVKTYSASRVEPLKRQCLFQEKGRFAGREGAILRQERIDSSSELGHKWRSLFFSGVDGRKLGFSKVEILRWSAALARSGAREKNGSGRQEWTDRLDLRLRHTSAVRE